MHMKPSARAVLSSSSGSFAVCRRKVGPKGSQLHFGEAWRGCGRAPWPRARRDSAGEPPGACDHRPAHSTSRGELPCLLVFASIGLVPVSRIKCVSVEAFPWTWKPCQLGFPADASQIGFALPITKRALGNGVFTLASSQSCFLFTVTASVSLEPN